MNSLAEWVKEKEKECGDSRDMCLHGRGETEILMVSDPDLCSDFPWNVFSSQTISQVKFLTPH